MRSYASALTAALLVAALTGALHAQSRGPGAEYAAALAQETALRAELCGRLLGGEFSIGLCGAPRINQLPAPT
jgi:hypothetical protein